MTSRTTSQIVTFRRPFWVSGLDRRLPAGTYTIELEEVAIEAIALQTWKLVATRIHVPRDGNTDYVRINREELNDALARDAEYPDETSHFGKIDTNYDLL